MFRQKDKKQIFLELSAYIKSESARSDVGGIYKLYFKFE